MNLLSQYKPSIDRIYGDRIPELRTSFSSILLILDTLSEMISCVTATDEQKKNRLDMLVGCTHRHIDLEERLMKQKGYESMDSHSEKHGKFVEMVEVFRVQFEFNTIAQNLAKFRDIQRWLSVHLLMDDAHFLSAVNK